MDKSKFMRGSNNERKRLEWVAAWYSALEGFEGMMVRFSAKRVVANCVGNSALEVGPAEGFVSLLLSNKFKQLELIEPAQYYVKKLQKILSPKVTIHQCLFEDFTSDKKYDNIVFSHLLEHVINPVGVLKRAAKLLSQEGAILITVPNAGSIHRRIGVKAGFIKKTTDPSPRDLAIGHRRIYTIDTLKKDISQANLVIKHIEGHFLKVLSNEQMDNLPNNLQKAFIEIGSEVDPEFCSELLVVCKLQ